MLLQLQNRIPRRRVFQSQKRTSSHDDCTKARAPDAVGARESVPHRHRVWPRSGIRSIISGGGHRGQDGPHARDDSGLRR